MSSIIEHINYAESFKNDSDNVHCQCDICEKTFAKKSNLTRHCRTVHGMDPSPRIFKHKCDICHHIFNNLSQLRYHQKREHMRIREIHKREKKVVASYSENEAFQLLDDESLKEQNTKTAEAKRHECPLCNKSFCRPDFPSHFEKEHKITLQVETLEFDSFTDFMEWKAFIEAETKSNYFKERSSKYGQMSYHYFICNRSGVYKAKGLGMKYLKTCKMNAYCPSSIRVQERKDGNCLVTYQKIHVGHKQGIDKVHSFSAEKQIARKGELGIPFDYPLDGGESSSISDNDLQNRHFPEHREMHSFQNLYQNNITVNDGQMTKYSNEDKTEIFHFMPEDNEGHFDRISNFDEDSEHSEASLEENEYESSIQQRQEIILENFTKIIKSASLSEEYDILEETLAFLKQKMDALKANASPKCSFGEKLVENNGKF